MPHQMTKMLDYYSTLAETTKELITDLYHSKSRPVVYNLDYSAIYPWIWANVSNESPMYDGASRDFCVEILRVNRSLPFGVLLTGPTFWELMDTFCRHLARQSEIGANIDYDSIVGKKRDELYNLINSSPDLTQKEIEVELFKFSRLAGHHLESAIDRATQLLGIGGPVRGIGDYIRQPVRFGDREKKKLEDLYNKMWIRRSSERRESDDKEFRYKVDCLNILLSQMISKGDDISMDYVTRAKYKQEFCADVGRIPLAPLFWSSIMRVDDFRDLKDKIEFFSGMRREALSLHKLIQKLDTLPRDDSYVGKRMFSFQTSYVDTIYDGVSGSDDASNMNNILSFVRSGRSPSRAVEQVSIIKDRVRALFNDVQNIIGDDLVLAGGLVENRKFNETRRAIEQ